MNPYPAFQPTPQMGPQPGISKPVTNIIQRRINENIAVQQDQEMQYRQMMQYQMPQPHQMPQPQQQAYYPPAQPFQQGGFDQPPANPLLQNAITREMMPELPVVENLPEPEKKGLDREIEEYDRRLEETDEALWNHDPSKAIKTGLPMFDAAFDGGLESGLYLLAAPANMGKTAFMIDLLDRIVKNNDNVLCLVGSLDDSLKKLIPRYISVNQRIQIREAKNPRNYEHDPVIMEKRAKGKQFLKDNKHKLLLYDANDSNAIEDWEDRIIQMRLTMPEGTKLMIFFDSFADLTSRDYRGNNDDMEIHISKEVKRWTTVYDCVVFGTMHLRKTNGKKRPTREDLKGTNRLDYDADLVWLLYNEVKVEKEASTIYWNEDGNAYKQPVIELNFAKNKQSDFDRVLFYHFSPSRNFLMEASEERQDGYLTQIYSG